MQGPRAVPGKEGQLPAPDTHAAPVRHALGGAGLHGGRGTHPEGGESTLLEACLTYLHTSSY